MDRVVGLLPLVLFLGGFAYCQHPILHCGNTCSVCVKGWYGPKCTLECLNCQNDECHKTTGECDNCKQGYHGRRCNETCSQNCGGSGACNRHTGNCDDSCAPSSWGQMCERNCSQMCNDTVCIKNTGKCHQGCQDGWAGYYCNVSCETDCVNTTCAKITKECIECKNGNNFAVCESRGLCNSMCDRCYKEERCKANSTRNKLENEALDESETNTPGAGTVIGGLVGAIAIVSLVVVGVIVYRRWHRKHRGGRESQGPEAVNLSHPEER